MPSRLRREFLGKEKKTELTAATKYLQDVRKLATDKQELLRTQTHKEGLEEGLNSVQEKREGKRCFRCNMTVHTPEDKQCPARDRECRKCHKVGQLAKCCKTKKAKDTND